jgi:hypothetical protein
MAEDDIDLSKYSDTKQSSTEVGVVLSVVPVATATAIPIIMSNKPPVFSMSNTLTNQVLTTLRQQGFPLGLAQELGNTKATYPIRYWIVDNSGYVIV